MSGERLVPVALIVEDDPAVVASLRAELSDHRVELVTAANVQAATEIIDQGGICGLILDLVLEEGASGLSILRHLETRGIALPTVVITHKLPDYLYEMLHDDQVKLVFPKPVEPRLLASVVLGLCGIGM